MPLILASNSASGGYNVANSLRFNSGSSDDLSKTFSASNRKTFTISFWIKRSLLSTNQGIIGAGDGAGNASSIFLPSADSIQYYNYVASSFPCNLVSSQVLRDVSAWYHVVLAYDSTQATSTNRVKYYVNGSQITLTGTYPSLNDDSFINSTQPLSIGKEDGYGNYLGAYLSEFYSIDGQALTPSSFGETDPSVPSSGIWKPKAYTGSYGTNGFYLQFKNSAALGTDSSGNGNNFTVNNLTSVDQSTDTCTNNFSTMNPLRQPTSNQATFTNGNLTVTTSSNNPSYYGGRSTMGVSSGKWYFEAKLVSVGAANIAMIGIQDTDSYTPELFNSGTGAYAGYSATGWSLTAAGNNYYNNNSSIAYSGSSFTAGDIISVALDLNNSKLYFAKNGTFMNSGVPTSGATGTGAISITTGLTYLFAVDDASSGDVVVWDCNFGSPPYSANSYTDGAGYGNFSYAVPSGYYSLNTKNLATYG